MTATDIKDALGSILEPSLRAAGLSRVSLVDDFDLRKQGVVDSLGFVQLLAALERLTGRPIDLSSLDPEHLTHVGALSRYIAQQQSSR